MRVLLTILMLLLLIPNVASACYAGPEEQSSSSDELIERTDNIVLARVTAAKLISEEGMDLPFFQVEYMFKTIETIKGQGEETFSIIGRPMLWGEDMESFRNGEASPVSLTEFHSEDKFWKSPVGRVKADPSCEIRPSFAVGSSYLVFLDKAYHQKSFELVNAYAPYSTVGDKWLAYVRGKINE